MKVKPAGIQAYGPTTNSRHADISSEKSVLAPDPGVAVTPEAFLLNGISHNAPGSSILSTRERFALDMLFGLEHENSFLYAGQISDQVKVGLLTDVKA